MSRIGFRSFAAALLVLVGLSALAIVDRAGGKSSGPTDTQAASAADNQRELDGVKTALMPLLQYVREGQPRDALKELSGGSDSPIGPAVMRTIHDGATSALANLEQLNQTMTGSRRSLNSIKAATSLYAEAAGLAEDASQGPQGARIEFATMGSRLLRLADALFDQARRVGGDDLPASAIWLDRPEPVPDIGLRVGAEAEQLAMTLAKPDSSKGDQNRPQRLRAIAQSILQIDGGR